MLVATLLCTAGSGSFDTPVSPLGASLAASVLPAPEHVSTSTDRFPLTAATRISAPAGATAVGEYLAAAIRRATGLPVRTGERGSIALTLDGKASLGPEGYHLAITTAGVRIDAHDPAGLFHGVQTLRQVIPERSGAVTLPGGTVTDTPRFAWRGASLDVARHFFSVAEVERYIDALALYKINTLHLHLTDDQGWRIEIRSRPRLTQIGAATEIGGGHGGFYTQDEYRALVKYAQDRFITVVPEIELPGHTNAALASYAELNCDGKARRPYLSSGVGFSSVCPGRQATEYFIADVFAEVAALTPGPFVHIGGDEVKSLTPREYASVVESAQRAVQAQHKTAIGWQEITAAALDPGTVVQYWQRNDPPGPLVAAAGKAKFVLSPADKTYLDMKYNPQTELGLSWAGFVEVRDAYDWDPATLLPGVGEARVLGVEAPIWTETLENASDVLFMAFPRLPAIAELGWSPRSSHDWDSFRRRLAIQAPHWDAMHLSYYRSPQIPWPR
ncbi:MAG: beta-N-acetylhexosaminidase [Actinomycetia bacterium]|nr:beta-N-acetylhexosaminidase [Actinomycetes bacterium]